jgi:glycerol-3-phosphate dehydrogenase
MDDVFDIAIIGGGINGAGIARDATGRGLSVYVCEKGDIGGATSSSSTKLLHGGLRYLEHYEFRLVREALEERERLWSIAPQIVRPLRFVLPRRAETRPAWMLRTGLFLYDHLGKRNSLPGTSSVRFHDSPVGEGLRPEIRKGFEYSDCWVEDNRLVVLNAQAARAAGARIETRTECTGVERSAEGWTLTTQPAGGGSRRRIRARILVNAAGPWANEMVRLATHKPPRGRIRMVQGSHLVTRKLYAHDRCFIFQNPDGRIIFTIPYEDDFTLIGTTDRDYDGALDQIRASEQEIDYLLTATSAYFTRPVTRDDLVWSYSGVRPLYDDGASAAQKATRDYVLELDEGEGAPLLSIFGGKITTYRRLAEAAMDKITALLPADQAARVAARKGWTGREKLPGGDFAPAEFAPRAAALARAHPFLGETEARRMLRQFGTRAGEVLGTARVRADLGQDFGAGLSEAEVAFMRREEWAETAEDILFRRTKRGIRMTPPEITALEEHLAGAIRSRAV